MSFTHCFIYKCFTKPWAIHLAIPIYRYRSFILGKSQHTRVQSQWQELVLTKGSNYLYLHIGCQSHCRQLSISVSSARRLTPRGQDAASLTIIVPSGRPLPQTNARHCNKTVYASFQRVPINTIVRCTHAQITRPDCILLCTHNHRFVTSNSLVSCVLHC